MPTPLDALADREFDVVVLGGGLTGSAVARALAARGARVVVVEAVDFGWGASGRTTRLAIGVLPATSPFGSSPGALLARERQQLVRSARHLARVVPVFVATPRRHGWLRRLSSTYQRWALSRIGSDGWPRPRAVTGSQLSTLFPGIAPPPGDPPQVHFDAVVDDRRLALATALDARRLGALLAPRCDIVGLEAGPEQSAWVEVRDRLSGATVVLRTKALVNATGSWIDRTRALFDIGGGKPLFTLKRGRRLVAGVPAEGAIVLPHPRDGRPIVMSPGAGGLLASEAVSGEGDFAARDGEREAAYLAEAVFELFPEAQVPAAVHFADTRPSLKTPGLVRESACGVPFWSVACAHPLLHRVAARQAALRLEGALGGFAGPRARGLGVLPGGDLAGLAGEEAAARAAGLQPMASRWLVQRYGSEWTALLREAGGKAEPVGPDEIPLKGEIAWAAQHEEARTLSDLLLRWRLPELAESTAEELAIALAAETEMAALLGWSPARRERERQRWQRERHRAYGEDLVPAPTESELTGQA